MKRRKVCAQGHVFYKSSDCPTCPTCEAAKRPADGFMAELAAPARRALQGAGLTTLARAVETDRGPGARVARHGAECPREIARQSAKRRDSTIQGATVAENKTRPTRVSVAAFLKKKATGQQLADSQELVKTVSRRHRPAAEDVGTEHRRLRYLSLCI